MDLFREPEAEKIMAFTCKTMLCVWWDLNHALIEKQPEWARRHVKVILQHDNAPSHTAKVVNNTLKALNWEILSHPPYSTDLAPSDYHLFASMGHSLTRRAALRQF